MLHVNIPNDTNNLKQEMVHSICGPFNAQYIYTKFLTFYILLFSYIDIKDICA